MITLEPRTAATVKDRAPLKEILAFVQSLNGELEPEQIMRRTVVAIAGAVGATQGGLAYLQGERVLGNCFWREGVWHERTVYLPLHASASGLVARTGKPYISNNVRHDARVTPAAKRDRDVQTLLSLPLLGHSGSTIAVLNLHDKHGNAPFTERDICVASAYLPHAAAAVERAELYAAVLQHERELDFLANHDPLTGLANRRCFFQKLEQELKTLVDAPEDQRICLALVDLDGLKDINETFGLQMGDQALLAAGHALETAASASALAARIGGDEYAILAWGCTTAQAASLEERLRHVAAHLGSHRTSDGRAIVLSGSIGIVWGAGGQTSTELLAEAERALYQQKHAVLEPARSDGPAYRPRGRRAVAEELAAILEAAGSLSAAADSETLLQRLPAEIARITDAEVASIGLLKEDGGLRFRCIWRQGTAELVDIRLPSTDGEIRQVLAQLGVFRTEQAVGQSPLTRQLIARYALRALLVAPMVDPAGRPLGVVLLANKRGGRAFTEHDANLTRAFASLAGALVDNVRLRAETHALRLTTHEAALRHSS